MENGKGTARETELLAATDVAELVGVKETTVYRWCKEGKLPCMKVGKHWRIRREALEDFLKRNEKEAKAGDEIPKGKKGDSSSRVQTSEEPALLRGVRRDR